MAMHVKEDDVLHFQLVTDGPNKDRRLLVRNKRDPVAPSSR